MSAENLKEFEFFNPNSVAIVSITHYPRWYAGPAEVSNTDKTRGDIALQGIQQANNLGFRVVIADSPQSSSEFKEQLRSLQNVYLTPRLSSDRVLGWMSGVRKSFELSSVGAFILTQPEKIEPLTEGCIEAIARPLVQYEADVVVPKREDNLFRSTYPDYMYRLEHDDNLYINRLLRGYNLLNTNLNNDSLDYFFGVFAFRNDPKVLTKIFSEYKFIGKREGAGKHISLDTSWLAVFEALRYNMKVSSVEIPFSYPSEQKRNEEDPMTILDFLKKRYAQRRAIILELVHYIRGFVCNESMKDTNIDPEILKQLKENAINAPYFPFIKYPWVENI